MTPEVIGSQKKEETTESGCGVSLKGLGFVFLLRSEGKNKAEGGTESV